MKTLFVKKKKSIFDGTYTVSLYNEDGEEMISRSFLEESEIFPVKIELIQIANKHGYEVK